MIVGFKVIHEYCNPNAVYLYHTRAELGEFEKFRESYNKFLSLQAIEINDESYQADLAMGRIRQSLSKPIVECKISPTHEAYGTVPVLDKELPTLYWR